MGAYNYARYVGRAIESALEQDYPSELMEIVVVDDGSTDNTAEVVNDLVASHPGRIKFVQQANGGYIAATNRAMAEAGGELLALLDADDVWLPYKVRRQVELLQARPALGMVFSDMVVVDGEEATVRPSLIGELGELPQRAFARILFQNVATQSSIMIRRSLRELFHPIPAGIPYADWWLTLRAAQVSEIDYVREPLALYREHGANLTGGVSGGAAGVREHRKEVAFQLWALRHLPLDSLTPDELQFVWSGVEEHARAVLSSAGSFFVAPADPDSEGAAIADARVAQADAAREFGDLEAEASLALAALAWDPFRVGARDRFMGAVDRATAALAVPHPLEGSRLFVTLADAEELIADDDMLRSYAEAMGGSELVTLAIDATRLEPDVAAQKLQALTERCGLGEREDIDLLAVVGARDAAQRHRMVSGSRARYRRSENGTDGGPPVFTPASLTTLRGFAQTSSLLGQAAAIAALS
jgi:hypothetical protein